MTGRLAVHLDVAGSPGLAAGPRLDGAGAAGSTTSGRLAAAAVLALVAAEGVRWWRGDRGSR